MKVSLYGTVGMLMMISTPNLSRRRFPAMSMWDSPIPDMIISLVSCSRCTIRVGSSSVSRFKAVPILSRSALVLGSMQAENTGLGKTMPGSSRG